MNMFVPRSPQCLLTDKHVIQLLRIHIKKIRVPLHILDANSSIQIFESRNRRIGLKWLHKSKLVEIARRNDPCIFIGSENGFDEVGGEFSLSLSVVYATIYGGSCIALETAASAFGAEMYIYGEEGTSACSVLANNLPLRDEGLAACCPGLISGIDTAGVVLECWAGKDFSSLESGSWIGFEEADERGFVEI
jgi:hypothetical protein